MEKTYNKYVSPFSTRYASDDMQYIFSDEKKFKTWRKLWIALAKAEKKEGLNITTEQIAELEKFSDNINYSVALEKERICKHDVMSHIHAYGVQCPLAKGIIHLGATSCYVGDNTEIIIMRDGLNLIKDKLINVISLLRNFALKYKDLPTLGYTHLQPAQLTTVGKRTTLWIHDLYIDYIQICDLIDGLKLLGSKGAVGSQASFNELFSGDIDKINNVELFIAKEMGFDDVFPVSGQTYTRKIDFMVMSVLSAISQSCSKFANDMRILQNFKEIEEPFEKNQVGSSAMPYKRNPMRTERITALSRYVIINSLNPAFTHSNQWFERTLDDSANKRISTAEGFLAVDSILNIMINVSDGLVVYPKVIEKRILEELPFIITENILMKAVKNGGDRQFLHEKIREHSVLSGRRIKEDGCENDLIDRISSDSNFGLTKEEILGILDPKLYIGLSDIQTQKFIEKYIDPLIDKNREIIGNKQNLNV